MSFTNQLPTQFPQDLIALGAAALDGSGTPALFADGLCVSPPNFTMSRVAVWRHPSAS